MARWMESFLKGRWLKHPLHAVLVHIPMGLWPAALVFDLLSQWSNGSNDLVRLAFYCVAAGLAVTLLAVPAGLADWSAIQQEKPAWKLGLYHLALNMAAIALFAVNLGLRLRTFQTATESGTWPTVLSAIGALLVLLSGYLGTRMVFAEGTSVARFSKGRWRRIAEQAGAHLPPAKQEG